MAENKVKLTVRVPRETADRIAKMADDRGISVNDFVNILLYEAARRDG